MTIDSHFAKAPLSLLRRTDISDGAKLCLIRLFGYDGPKVEFPCPKIATLAKDLGVSEVTVKRRLKELKDKGLIVPIRRGKKLSNQYKINYPQLGYDEVSNQKPHSNKFDTSQGKSKRDTSILINKLKNNLLVDKQFSCG